MRQEKKRVNKEADGQGDKQINNPGLTTPAQKASFRATKPSVKPSSKRSAKAESALGPGAFAPSALVQPQLGLPSWTEDVLVSFAPIEGFEQTEVSQQMRGSPPTVNQSNSIVGLSGQMVRVFDQLKLNKTSDQEIELANKFTQAVMAGTQWLSSSEVDRLSGAASLNRNINANRWLKREKVFALSHRGKAVYPRYQFDINGAPIREIEDILKILGHRSPMQIAAWFESRTALLDGKRPREVIGQNPRKVLEAAKTLMSDELHG